MKRRSAILSLRGVQDCLRAVPGRHRQQASIEEQRQEVSYLPHGAKVTSGLVEKTVQYPPNQSVIYRPLQHPTHTHSHTHTHTHTHTYIYSHPSLRTFISRLEGYVHSPMTFHTLRSRSHDHGGDGWSRPEPAVWELFGRFFFWEPSSPERASEREWEDYVVPIASAVSLFGAVIWSEISAGLSLGWPQGTSGAVIWSEVTSFGAALQCCHMGTRLVSQTLKFPIGAPLVWDCRQ